MRVHFAVTMVILAFSPAVHAEEFVVRDARGQTMERIVPGNAPGQLIRRDPLGRRIGTIEDSSGDNKVLRDPSGRRIGTVERGANDDWIVRDTLGRRTETLGSTPLGADHVRRDPSGKRLGSVEAR